MMLDGRFCSNHFVILYCTTTSNTTSTTTLSTISTTTSAITVTSTITISTITTTTITTKDPEGLDTFPCTFKYLTQKSRKYSTAG